ncbi:MAG: hypothetical protein HY342_07745 [Candidatus Lambdaproteobacteria bacterium]|nr:hypothetical protein [Candidatus Lambdaproteobacteria bacterium]
MAALLLGAAGGLAPAARADEPLGAFFTQVNTYLYSDGPNAGARVLVRARQTFTVIDLTNTADGTVWYRIVFPERDTRLEGVGWVFEAPHEILERQGGNVTVYEEIPRARTAVGETVSVPTQAIKQLNITEPSTRFAEITWYKVQYSAKIPLTPWIRAATGIYRPGVSAEFITRVYANMVARNIKVDKVKRLLSGVIQVGDSKRDVEWGLGDPLHVREETAGDIRRVFWQYAMVVVQFENDVVKQIN